MESSSTRRSSRPVKKKKMDESFVSHPPASTTSGGAVSRSTSEIIRGSTSSALRNRWRKHKVGKFRKTQPTAQTLAGLAARKSTSLMPTAAHLRQLGRWKVEDDYLLIHSVLQLGDLRAVHMVVRFSCTFTEGDMRERWRALLMSDAVLSSLARERLARLSSTVKAALDRRVPLSPAEEELLEQVSAERVSAAGKSAFLDLLDRSPGRFFPGRTASLLHKHWRLLHSHGLLRSSAPGAWLNPEQAPQTYLHDAEFLAQRSIKHDTTVVADECRLEIASTERHAMRRLRRLEEEAKRWEALSLQLLPAQVASMAPSDFPTPLSGAAAAPVLAVLAGRETTFSIFAKETCIGRSCVADIDLSLEGVASGVSRFQAWLRLLDDGTFHLSNAGRRPLFVCSRALVRGSATQLHDQDVIQICALALTFRINPQLSRLLERETRQCRGRQVIVSGSGDQDSEQAEGAATKRSRFSSAASSCSSVASTAMTF